MAGKKRGNIWDDLFGSDFAQIEEMMNELMKRGFEDIQEGKPAVYGFNIRVGPEGKPVIEEFGNVKPGKRGPEISEEREPLVDVIDRDADITVIAELPGVHKDDIHADVKDSSLEISVAAPDRRYHKLVELPAKVDRKSARATYKNGILEIVLRKLEKRNVSGIRIQ